jgi:hypothetical protein
MHIFCSNQNPIYVSMLQFKRWWFSFNNQADRPNISFFLFLKITSSHQQERIDDDGFTEKRFSFKLKVTQHIVIIFTLYDNENLR